MINQLKAFIKTSLIGGFTIILPAAILFVVFRFLFNLVTDFIQPLTNILTKNSHIKEFVADGVVIIALVGLFFLIGILVKTQIGSFLHYTIETKILKIAPGYRLVKETVMQFLGQKKMPFGKVALVKAFSNQALMTAFVTSEHENGWYTVFIPTGPNPTSGNIFHLPPEYVTIIPVPVDQTMRTIIGCGAGSQDLIEKFLEKKGTPVNKPPSDELKSPTS